MTRRLAKSMGLVEMRKNMRSKAPGAAGKVVRALDGREGLCITSKRVKGKLVVRCGGKLHLWGPEAVGEAELERVMGKAESSGSLAPWGGAVVRRG